MVFQEYSLHHYSDLERNTRERSQWIMAMHDANCLLIAVDLAFINVIVIVLIISLLNDAYTVFVTRCF